MQVYDLALEVTRKCNLKCDHCCRGNAQRKSMDFRTLHNTLHNISYISSVTFTGGEPSLVPEFFEMFNQYIIGRRIRIGWFYCVTNGMPHNRFRKFLEHLQWLHGWVDEPDQCCLEMSQDQFHPRDNRSLRLFKDEYDEYLPFFNPKGRTYPIPKPLNEGRARETGVGVQDPDEQRPWEVEEYDGELHVREGILYVAVNGNVVSNCNMSFKRVDAEHKGNVNEKPLQEIIESFCTQEEECNACAVQVSPAGH